MQQGASETHTMGEKKVPVVEIFGPTIEGEGALIGKQTFFIRFGLCDYKCKKCDSMHAVDPKMVKAGADWATPTEIAESFLRYTKQHAPHIKNVTFSGGNPAIHELGTLVRILQGEGFKVFVETQGTKTPDWLWNVDHIVCSPKSPGMGEKFEIEVFREFVHKYLSNGTPLSVKIVIFSALDIEFAADVSDWLEVNTVGFLGYQHNQNFYLSQGNPYPPDFRLNISTGKIYQLEAPTLALLETDKNAQLDDNRKNEITNKMTLVDSLLNSYNILSAEVMRHPRLAHARFLPQLHVLVWGNETGK